MIKILWNEILCILIVVIIIIIREYIIFVVLWIF